MARERIPEEPPLSRLSLPPSFRVLSLTWAMRCARITLLALATPTETLPAPPTEPARLQISRLPRLAFNSRLPTSRWLALIPAFSPPSITLLVEEPEIAAVLAPAPDTAAA